jgi:hypothetical protein
MHNGAKVRGITYTQEKIDAQARRNHYSDSSNPDGRFVGVEGRGADFPRSSEHRGGNPKLHPC